MTVRGQGFSLTMTVEQRRLIPEDNKEHNWKASAIIPC
jgi:hypothetical protein